MTIKVTPQVLSAAEEIADGRIRWADMRLARELRRDPSLAENAAAPADVWVAIDCDDGSLIGSVGQTHGDAVGYAQEHRNRTGKYCRLRSCVPGSPLTGSLRYPPTVRRADGSGA